MLENREGEKVPEVTFRTREGNEWKDVTTDDLFAGKNVVVFGLPVRPLIFCVTTNWRRCSKPTALTKSSVCR